MGDRGCQGNDRGGYHKCGRRSARRQRGEAFIFLYGVGCVPCGAAPHLVHFTMYPGPLPTHFSHSPDELRPAVFFSFFSTGRTSSDFWVAETLEKMLGNSVVATKLHSFFLYPQSVKVAFSEGVLSISF